MTEPVPRDGLPAGLFEHPRPDGKDHPRVLKHRQEVLGVDDATHRVPPTQKRFDPPDTDAVEFEYRLVDEKELVLLQGLSQICLELETLHGGRLHGCLEADVTVPPLGLCLAQGDGGVAQQIVRLVAFIGRDADAGGDRQGDVVEPLDAEWLLQGVEQSLGKQLRPPGK